MSQPDLTALRASAAAAVRPLLGVPLAALLAALLAAGLHAPAARAESHYPAGASRPLSKALHAGQAPRAAAAKAKKPARRRKPRLHGNPLRAQRAFAAMQRFYYIPGSGLYSGEPFSYLWPFSQALAATVSMSNVAHLPVSLAGELRARLIGLRNYLDVNNAGAPEGNYTSTLAAFDGTVAPPAGPGGAKYYDDNDWVGIELARRYRLTRD